MVVSNDGGASYFQPSDYVIARQATEWSSSFPCSGGGPAGNTTYGDFGSTNIVQKDGYYYSFYEQVPTPGSSAKRGACVMRTQDLADASERYRRELKSRVPERGLQYGLRVDSRSLRHEHELRVLGTEPIHLLRHQSWRAQSRSLSSSGSFRLLNPSGKIVQLHC